MDLLVSTTDPTTNILFPVLSRDSHEAPREEKYLSLPSEANLSDLGILSK